MVLNKENSPLLLAFFLSSKLKQDLFLLKPKNKEEQDFLHPRLLCPLGTGSKGALWLHRACLLWQVRCHFPFPFAAEDLLGVGALSHLSTSYRCVSAKGCTSSGVSRGCRCEGTRVSLTAEDSFLLFLSGNRQTVVHVNWFLGIDLSQVQIPRCSWHP